MPDAIGPWLFGQSDRFGRRVGFEHNANTGVQNFGHPGELAKRVAFVAGRFEAADLLLSGVAFAREAARSPFAGTTIGPLVRGLLVIAIHALHLRRIDDPKAAIGQHQHEIAPPRHEEEMIRGHHWK